MASQYLFSLMYSVTYHNLKLNLSYAIEGLDVAPSGQEMRVAKETLAAEQAKAAARELLTTAVRNLSFAPWSSRKGGENAERTPVFCWFSRVSEGFGPVF